jgi:hypothetical protein
LIFEGHPPTRGVAKNKLSVFQKGRFSQTVLARKNAACPRLFNNRTVTKEDVMSKLSVRAAVLLLSSVWVLAQISAASMNQNPASPESTQQPDKSRATSDKAGDVVEGCLSGAADVFTLTDATGKTYELTGDTRDLAGNVGHKVRLFGYVGNSGGGNVTTVSGPQATFGVKKVQSLSSTCQ